MNPDDYSGSFLGETVDRTAREAEKYIESHLFDPFGLMYSGIDLRTGKPFERDFVTPVKVSRRAAFDPWTYWTYEDSIMAMGQYIDGLLRKFELTGDRESLVKAGKVWQVVKNIYYCSQIHGIGSFLRPYGGYLGMHRFLEPLGTDQAGPLFHGLYLYMKHVGGEEAAEIADIMLRTLDWYEQQNFRYFYYKSFVHHWDIPFQHAASYYLPAIAWAARVTGSEKWERHLRDKLALFEDERYRLYMSFNWGSSLPILAEVLGEYFAKAFPQELLDNAWQDCMDEIRQYAEPGIVKRVHPESAQPGVKPYLRDEFDPNKDLGLRFFYSVHGGRCLPRRELEFLCCLTSLGYKGAREKAAELLALRKDVPADFTHFLSRDYDILPEDVHIYARSVGVILVGWWRNYWHLRGFAP